MIKKIVMKNTILLDILANNIATIIVKDITNDASLTKIVTSVTQVAYTESKGLTDLVKSFTGPLALVFAILIIGFAFFGGKLTTTITNPKFMIIAFVMVAAYLILANRQKWRPFRQPAPVEHWGCQKDSDGYNTGKCTMHSNAVDGPFENESLCSSAVTKGQVCNQYWGCKKDTNTKLPIGECARYATIVDGPFSSELECNSSVKAGNACREYWTCNYNADGKLDGTCVQLDMTRPDDSLLNFKTKDACINGKQCVAAK